MKLHDYFELKLSENVIKNINNNVPVELQKFVNNILINEASDSFTAFVDNLSLLIMRSISFVITFLIIYAILLLLTTVINTVMKLPLLNLTNRVFGALMGILKSVIAVYVRAVRSGCLLSYKMEVVYGRQQYRKTACAGAYEQTGAGIAGLIQQR